MCSAIIVKIDKLIRLLLRPVAARPLLFVLLILLGTAAPLAMHFVTGASLNHYILFTASVCSVEAYIFCLILLAIKKRKVCIALQTLLYIVYGFGALTETACVVLFDKPMGVDMVSLAMETNPAEATGFFEAYFSLKLLAVWALSLLGVALVSVGVLLFCRRCRRWRWTRYPLAAALLALLVYGLMQIAFIVSGYSKMADGQRGPYHGNRTDLSLPIQLNLSDPIVKAIDITKEYRQLFSNIDNWERLQYSLLDEKISADTTRHFDIALLIGESFIRSHSSLYGYDLQVNPLLSRELQAGRLVLFSDAATPANLTTEVMRNALNLNDVAADERWYESVYFPSLLKQAGWRVYHYDNQTVGTASDSGISRLFYSPFNMEHTLDGVSDSSFEFDLPYAEYVREQLKDRKAGNSLVMYHLLGQHFPASARFEGEAVFKASDIKAPGLSDVERQLVADYDNATLYNDRVVASIIDSWRDKPAVLFYFSDHGEDLPDLGPVGGRVTANPADAAWVQRQFHIPFMIWMSDSFVEQYPALAAQIRQAADRPLMLDKLGYMILGLAGVQTSYYRPQRDALSPQYRAEPRMTIGHFSVDGYPKSGVDK